MLYTVHHVSVPLLLPPTDCGANRCQVTPPQGVGGWELLLGWAGRSLRYFLTFADDRIGTCSSIRRVKPSQRLKAHSCVVGDFFNFNGASVCLMPYLQKKVGPANIWKGLPILRSWKGKRDERQSPLGSFHTNRGQFDKENSPLHSCLIKYIHTYITNIVQNIKMCGRFGRLQLLLYSDNFFV